MSKDQVYKLCTIQCILIVMIIIIIKIITLAYKFLSQIVFLGSSNKKSNSWRKPGLSPESLRLKTPMAGPESPRHLPGLKFYIAEA